MVAERCGRSFPIDSSSVPRAAGTMTFFEPVAREGRTAPDSDFADAAATNLSALTELLNSCRCYSLALAYCSGL